MDGISIHGQSSKFGLAIAPCAMIATSVAQSSTSANIVVIRAGSLIDGEADLPKKGQVVVVRGDRVDEIQDAAGFRVPEGARMIDLSHDTAMPGLINAHTHLLVQGEDPAGGGYDVYVLRYPFAYRVALATVAAKQCLEQGFTAVRDLETEGAGYSDIGLKQAIDEGIIPGPRIFAATRAISTTGRRFTRRHGPRYL